MNILMIEDNESVSEMMQMFFLNEGWEATFKDDGKEGLATFLASPEKWDMITLDLNLPSMDGMAVCREIRKVSANVPINFDCTDESSTSSCRGGRGCA